jgi:hypothetical protein
MGYVSFSVKTAIISLNIVNKLMFAMVTSCVLFQAQNDFSNII